MQKLDTTIFNTNNKLLNGSSKIIENPLEVLPKEKVTEAITGKFFPEPFDVAVKLCRKGQHRRVFKCLQRPGYANVLCRLAFRLEVGKGVKEDEQLAIEAHELAAEKGEALSQFNLGVRYEDGKGVPKCRKIAKHYYKLAALRGHKGAASKLQAMKKRLEERSPRKEEGLKRYTLAHKLLTGANGHKKYETEGIKQLMLAADLGDPEAQHSLAESYKITGYDKLMVHWLKRAAEQGHLAALNNLALSYARGLGGLTKSPALSVRYLKMGVILDSDTTQFNLGLCYEEGDGVPVDDEKALKLMQRSAAQNYAPAKTDLGIRYLRGKGLPKNEKRAIALFQEAKSQGDLEAYLQLGKCYAYGIGMEKNDKRAMKLLQIAADKGSAEAQFAIGVTYVTGIGLKANLHKGLDYLKKAADQHDKQALEFLKGLAKI